MGSGVCGNFVKKGYPVIVYDVDPASMRRFQGSAELAGQLTDVLRHDVIFLSLPGSDDVEQVVAAFIEHGVRNKTVIDLSTSFPLSSRKLFDDMTNAGGDFADAPLTGSPGHAAEGSLIVTFGGRPETFEALKPEFACFTREAHYIGGAGAGNICKLMNNYLAIMYVALYAEIFPLGEKLGVDVEKLFGIIGNSSVDCAMYRNAGKKIVDQRYEPSFQLQLALKDLKYIRRLFDQFGAEAPLLNGGVDLLEAAVTSGLGERDISEVARLIRGYLKMT
jgi:3-hydroxyisobutyrate dehydrogenase-like beta-hydroxyacid dehydrogenase